MDNAEQLAQLCTAELRAATLLIPDKPASLRRAVH
jgi:hypothetical protein